MPRGHCLNHGYQAHRSGMFLFFQFIISISYFVLRQRFLLKLIRSYFAGVSPQTCQYRGVSEFCLLYLPARDVSPETSGNCRITLPNGDISLLWYETGRFLFSIFLYTHAYAYRERGKKWCDADEVPGALITLYLTTRLGFVTVSLQLPQAGDTEWLWVFKQV